MDKTAFELIRSGLFKMLSIKESGNVDTVQVASTCLSEVSYNVVTKNLTVTFVESGNSYMYYNVEESDYESLVSQFGSVGEVYNEYIKNNYAYTRLA